MKQKCLVYLLFFSCLSALGHAQKKESANKTDLKNAAANFNKIEPDYSQLQNELKQLEQQSAQLLTLMRNFNEQQKQAVTKLGKLEKSYDGMAGAASGGNSQSQLMAATQQMQEMQMSFNLQYLQLQSQMQNENRSYTAVSNIMKTKHDTVKNSISNIR